MIRGVRANRSGFRAVTFTSGLNVVLADRSSVAGEKDTTNALGKSTLIDIIDFCLGSNSAPGKGLRVDALLGWEFTLDLDLLGQQLTVSRRTDAPGAISLSGDVRQLPIQPEKDSEGRLTLDLRSWRALLGRR